MTRQQAKKAVEMKQNEELEVLRVIEMQRIEIKKKNDKACKQQEEEAKKKKDKEDALKQAEAEAAAIIAAQETESEKEMDKPDGDLNRNLNNIFNGIATEPKVLEELRKPEQEPEECSPTKKRV
jgi:hypothetical protein